MLQNIYKIIKDVKRPVNRYRETLQTRSILHNNNQKKSHGSVLNDKMKGQECRKENKILRLDTSNVIHKKSGRQIKYPTSAFFSPLPLILLA